jgi:leader peptidase (prepilin peptidase)/N-methyltransferase
MTGPLDRQAWAAVPFHFWSVVFFVFGSLVGSFLNVCIHRLPRGESVISPPSHCPHCRYSIPWFLNVPLVTWLMLRGRCRNCGEPISPRYFLVELLTALAFLACWLNFGRQSAALAVVYCVVLAGFLVATFIDFEHLIIPDEITLGGMVVGFFGSFLVPSLHQAATASVALERCLLGAGLGAGIVYGILRMGKLLYGRQRVVFERPERVHFTETALRLPSAEIPYEELFYRRSDTVRLQAERVEMVDRCYIGVPVRLSSVALEVGSDRYRPEEVEYLEVMTDRIDLPREAMGLGDVKFMGAIGAFLGWQAVLFSLMASAMIGSLIGVGLIALGKREWSSRLPYGPYIAVAATVWIFFRRQILSWWL